MATESYEKFFEGYAIGLNDIKAKYLDMDPHVVFHRCMKEANECRPGRYVAPTLEEDYGNISSILDMTLDFKRKGMRPPITVPMILKKLVEYIMIKCREYEDTIEEVRASRPDEYNLRRVRKLVMQGKYKAYSITECLLELRYKRLTHLESYITNAMSLFKEVLHPYKPIWDPIPITLAEIMESRKSVKP